MTQTTKKQTLFGELKRRNVFRVGIAYVVVAWLVLQVADVVLNNIAAPGWVFQVILLLLAIGLPLALVFAWAFELTPEGVKRESEVDRSHSITPRTVRRLDFVIIAVLAVALGWFAWDKFGRDRAAREVVAERQADPAAAAGSGQKSVAVLPFVALSSQNAEYTLAFLSGDWRGLKGRIDLVISDRGCNDSFWLDATAAMYRIADRYLPRIKEIRTCDPLVSNFWFREARAMLWSGDVAGALALTRQGLELAPGSNLNRYLIAALAATGQFDRADQEISDRITASDEAKGLRTMVTSARGKRDAAATLREDYLRETGTSGFWALQVHAWLGDRKDANRIARRIYTHPFGSQQLVQVVSWCFCGAPFDLDATPDFAAKLDEAGMPWPPASPIRFPLKKW